MKNTQHLIVMIVAIHLFLLALAVTGGCSREQHNGSSSPIEAITKIILPTAEAASLPECCPSEVQSVIWVKDTGKLMFCSPESKWVEVSVSATSIDAKNVTLGTPQLGLTDAPVKTAGYLSATNIQDAMSVVAMDLSTVLPGSTWTADNRSKEGPASGTVTFTKDGQIDVTDGGVLGLGISSDHCGYDPDDTYSYEIISGNVMMENASVNSFGAGPNGHVDAEYMIKFTAQDADTLLIMGSGACWSAKDHVSILHRVKS